ncbi:MAG: 50S ribosomal protein L9 [Kiritimatiellae bacterium]|nr:50S ribosomal protein L9 [Kiritimatiellia bacterium]MBP5322052.1 50S ribosomal protein L9 [Kiritimatiellia bacterium]
MATELLLLSDVEHLGQAGDVVKVADGYARNYLLPKDLAAPVTKYALRRLEKLRKEREELARLRLAEAKAKAGKLAGLVLTITAKTVDGTRLYGSIGVQDIVDALDAKSISVDKSQIQLEEAFKEIGTFEVPVKLHADVIPTIKVDIIEG